MPLPIEKPFQKLLWPLRRSASQVKPASFLCLHITAFLLLPQKPSAKDLLGASLCSVWLTHKVTGNSKANRIYIGRQAKAQELKSEMCQEHSSTSGNFLGEINTMQKQLKKMTTENALKASNVNLN